MGLSLFATSSERAFSIPVNEIVPNPVIGEDAIHIDKPQIPQIQEKGLSEFMAMVRRRESSNRQRVVNRYGMLGYYQFKWSTLQWIGYKGTKQEFLDNPDHQHQAMIALLKRNKSVLQRYIKRYSGKQINGIRIDESGLLMASHLVGANAVKRYLRTNGNKVAKDGNNTSLEEYLRLGYGFKLNL